MYLNINDGSRRPARKLAAVILGATVATRLPMVFAMVVLKVNQ
jgi:hypothetical protein